MGAVGADASTQTGQGIRIAVLDTGLDLSHPDFAGRSIETKSFAAGQPVQDGNGHGTHCAGIAAGPAKPARQVRYGVAGEAELYVGKVLGDEGSGGDGGILEGDGGEIDLAAPGVDVLSSWPAPDLYRTLSGTSMATPFVTGVAALYAQSDPKVRGSQLWEQLLGHVRPLQEAQRDVGAGLVQAPGAVTRKH